MSTAFVFAPLTCFLRPEDRFRYRHIEEVQARFSQAEAILRERSGVQVCFDDLFDQPTTALYQPGRINLTAAMIIAMQLGVVDRLVRFRTRPTWVVGCSLGDVARTVCAGVCDLETALHVAMLSLREVKGANQIGSNVVVLTTPRHPFTAGDLAWFTSMDLAVTQLSDCLLNVSGRFPAIEQLMNKARQQRWRTFHVSDFPVHSPHLAGYTEMAREMVARLPVQAPAPGTRVYSSLFKREVKCPEEFREEFIRALVAPHNWKETVSDLVEHCSVTKFVNIGPCRTLSRVLRRMGQEVLEADDLIRAQTPGTRMATSGAQRPVIPATNGSGPF